MNKIDKFGPCPACKISWEGKDKFDELNNLSVFTHKSQKDMLELVDNYGYNKDKFTRVIVIEIEDGRLFYKCPSIRCNMIFDPITGMQFGSVQEASKINVEKDVEIPPTSGTLAEILDVPEEEAEKLTSSEDIEEKDDVMYFEKEPDEVDGGEMDSIDEFDKFFKKKKL